MNNKNGQQMTLGTIIAIVLGLVVLVFLIYGFSTGWGNLWDRVNAFGGGSVNVDTINTACVLACQQNSEHGFCVQTRKVVEQEGEDEVTGTCYALGELGIVDKCSTLDSKPKCVAAAAKVITDAARLGTCTVIATTTLVPECSKVNVTEKVCTDVKGCEWKLI